MAVSTNLLSLCVLLCLWDSCLAGFGEETGYMGCYVDMPQRMLTMPMVGNSAMTIDWCKNYCASKNASYYGVQYRTQCFCGNNPDFAKYERRPENECNGKCGGNQGQMCGGTWRNSLFKL